MPGNMTKTANELHEGDDVSWNWGTSIVTGTVAEIVNDGTAEVTSNKGNVITRHAKEGDPAVRIERQGNDVVKLAHELNEVKEGQGQ